MIEYAKVQAIRKQDISSLIVYCLGYSWIKNIVLRLMRKPILRIVAFHDILPNEYENFKRNIAFLKRKTNVINFADFFAGRVLLNKINVIITFDDGYLSWITRAIPTLKEFGLQATFFISSGFVGLSEAEEREFLRLKLLRATGPGSNSGSLSYESVKTIAAEGFFIGGHTINHIRLKKSPADEHVCREIVVDKKLLEEMSGKQVAYFSYPFGDYDNPWIDLGKLLQNAGFQGAVTTSPGFNELDSDPYRLHRELTPASMHPFVFRARVLGNYDAILFLKKCLRAIMGRG